MTEQEKRTVFGQVLAEYLERQGFPADDEGVRNLAFSAGLEDPEGFLRRVRGEDMDYVPPSARQRICWVSASQRRFGWRVFEYVRVPENQPSWAINFVRSTRPLSDGRYAMQTPAGELIYRIEEDPRCRTVDFVYETPEGQTTMILPTRVVPHGRGSVFTFTVHRQPGMGDIEWKEGQRGLNEELAELKKLLET